LNTRIKVGAVSYLNTKPLLYGIENSAIINEIEISSDYPALLASQLSAGTIDMALLPVAAIPGIEQARIVSNYGIASDGNVVSVAIFSHVPMEEVTAVYLDYQSRTSVRLAQLLLEHYWKKEVKFIAADEHYISKIAGNTAGVIIGDRALQQLGNFKYNYDLSAAWKAHTGLDFVFAAWVANKELPASFLAAFDAANAEGLNHFQTIIADTEFPWYDLDIYYNNNIKYLLDQQKKAGLDAFLKMIG
jgi:chorismate dehydratase